MRPVGRIITTIGILLIALAVVGGAVGWTQFGPVPGIVLIFMGRALAKQARRSDPSMDDLSKAPSPAPQAARPAPVPRTPPQQPTLRPKPTTASKPPAPTRVSAPRPTSEPEKAVTMGALHDALADIVDEREPSPPSPPMEIVADGGEFAPMSSEEMIARARERWGKRP